MKQRTKKMAKEQSKELVVATQYAVCGMDASELSNILREAAGSAGITPQDLDQVKIPAGGGAMWQVPTLEGEDSVKSIEGIIVHHQDARAYWGQTLEESGGNSPPDCQSPDALHGMGTPGGDCMKCPLAQFGSDRKNRGQACKAIKIIYLVTAENLLPMALTMPPTSIKPMRQYLLRLASRGLKASDVVTVLTLEKDKNVDGVAYSKALPAVKEKLTPEVTKVIATYSLAFKVSMGQINISQSDVG